MSIPVLSFFTGGGFLDLGFEQAGFDIRWTNEVNPVFADCYEYGMTAWRRAQGVSNANAKISNRSSITDLASQRVLSEAFGGAPPRVFGIIGGPPCPDFSAGGKHAGGDGENGRLSRTFVELIAQIQPAFFVFENVPGLYRFKAHRQFLNSLRSYLEETGDGYIITSKLLNALEFGVPQDRERLFMVGFSKTVINAFAEPHQVFSDQWFPWPKPPYENAKQLPWPGSSEFGARPDYPERIPELLTVNSVFATDPPPGDLPNGTEGFKPHSPKFQTVPEGATGGSKSFKRLHRYRYSPTAWYGNNEVHLHPWEARRLTVREAMRIQSIPDTYQLPPVIALAPKFKLICNGVPCKLARSIGGAVREFLRSLYDQAETESLIMAHR